MALPTLDATFASAADVPRRYMLAQWLVNELGSGSIADYVTFPERYLWAKIAVAAGAPKDEAAYIGLPKQYAWKDIYDAVSGSSLGTIDWTEKQALGHIAAAYRGDTGNPANLATYIDWPWRYQVASIIIASSIDSDVAAFIAASGATDVAGLDAFVRGIKDLGLWDSMVAWPLRSSQNAGTGTTAYSLGGLGSYDGTLVDGPIWTDDGINFLTGNTSSLISTGLSASQPFSFYGCMHFATNIYSGGILIGSGTSNSVGNAFAASTNRVVMNAGASLASSNTYTPLAKCFIQGYFNGVSSSLSLDGTNVTGNAGSNNFTDLKIGNTITQANKDYEIAFAMIVPNQNVNASVSDLYKNTLGVGLGLP